VSDRFGAAFRGRSAPIREEVRTATGAVVEGGGRVPPPCRRFGPWLTVGKSSAYFFLEVVSLELAQE